MAQAVSIHNSEITNWGIAENRAQLLVRSFIKLGEPLLAEKAKALLDDARHGYDEAYKKAI